MSNQTGSNNPNWRGGRTISDAGYVLLRMPGHHLADVRGYVYEHRFVAEQKIGRRLEPGELVHHDDENRQNNDPDNLIVVSGNAEHFLLHRKLDYGRRNPGEENPVVACACGCGESFPKFDSSGRPRKFVSGHNGPDLAGDILCYLECVPESGRTKFIAEFLVANEGSVRNALTRLRKAGKVENHGNQWSLVS